ncbi:transcription factor atoh8 isoform X2 [Gouania willdenowi]|uniref:Protein atonal homolog 8 n=1 Tax=Gouania willdenowi TaxID=441366 RepID=A0A8C5H7X0_GOUWI|nr:protein atonal homolog 8 isoform X2 [Gouania willdenowi]
MKNLLPMNTAWKRSMIKDPGPETNKKFKRKSREPKRLFTGSQAEGVKMDEDLMDVDSVDDASMEACHVNKFVAVHRHLRAPQEATASTSGFLSEVCSSHGGALDMRIGINVPTPAFPEISNWPTSISQPLTNRLRHSFQSSFPSPAASSSRSAPQHTFFSMEPSPLTGQAAPPIASPGQEHMEAEVPSPKSPRKRVGTSVDGHGHGRLPEVKAIQQTRRLLANARERTRVHTISAAFEALRKQVPCYSYGQKLSKLAILRIACNYILSLAQLAEVDHSAEHGTLSFSQCVEQCTRTLQAEGRSKKRKVGRLTDDA